MSYLEIRIFFHKLVDFEKELVTFPLFNSCLYISQNDPPNCEILCPGEGGDKAFFLQITWRQDQWVMWFGGWDTLTLNHEGYSKSNITK